jgi:hypothetical protein
MRWLWSALPKSAVGLVVFSAACFVLSGCGGGGATDQSGFPQGEDGGPVVYDATTPVNFNSDATVGDAALPCTPLTCAQQGLSCGQGTDGCGNIIPSCGTCTAPGESCGGGGVPSQCGGGAACVPKTCADPSIANLCGQQADGCGGVVATPCVTCNAPQTCGGGGTPNECGGSAACVPLTTSQACVLPDGGTMNCGVMADGCGDLLACSPTGDAAAACPAGETCGGGGIPSVCGHPTCTPIPEATACAFPDGGTMCGLASNGCGGTWTCPACTGGTTCGGGGVPSACGSPPCTPATTCPANVNCGPWPNGCGGIIASCGTCTGTDICGGGGVPSECGNSSAGAGCDAGLVCDLPTCADGGTTSLSGVVYDPAHKNPLYDVVVYVPNDPIPLGALSHGVPSCGSCSSLYLGNPVTATTTGTDGSFTLTNVPVPASGNVPVVIQVGKWRRQFTWPGVSACNPNPASLNPTVAALLQLPGAENAAGPVYDDLPEIAVSTGGADSMECLFQRIGFASSEYTTGAGGAGHIHIFTGSSQGASTGAGTHNSAIGPDGGESVSKSHLWNSLTDLDPYDIVILSCEGAETRGNNTGNGGGLSTTDLQALTSYATNGGRVFASHFHYAWFNQGGTGTFGADNLATWTPNADNPNTGYGTGAYSDPIDDQNGDDQLNANVITTYADGGTFPRGSAMYQWLKNVSALGTNGAPTNELYISNPRFNVYVPPASSTSQAWLVPDNATYTYTDESNQTEPLGNSTQYMSFDTPVGGTGDAGAPYCGRAVYSDLHVGAASGDYGGFESSGTPKAPTNCADGSLSPQEKALEFMLLDLASCVTGDTNLPTPPPAVCTPLTQCPASYECGEYPNGCGDGGLLQCGTCEAGASCIEGKCVACVPATTCPTGVTCGLEPDGCGGSINCGTCAATAACVGGTCTTGCTPITACPAGITCGPWPDGCGGTINCGDCTVTGESCGGAGTPGVCGQGDANACNPFACLTYHPPLHCGPAGDGCGGLLNCGECDAGTCGGGGTPGVCGSPSCTPATCASLNASCGQVADGCGGLTPVCGTCTGNQTCGGAGTPNQCGVPGCTPRTCQQAGANCGPVADGCGGIIQCGTCTAPDTCGGGGTVSVCGSNGPK